MSSPGFPGGFGASDLYGRAGNPSGRSTLIPSNLNNMNHNTNNFPTAATTTATNNFQNPFFRTQQQLPSNPTTTTTQNYQNHFFRTQQQQLPSTFIGSSSQNAQNRSSNLIRNYLDPSSQIAQRHTSNLLGKRTLAEFQTHNNNILSNNSLSRHNTANAQAGFQSNFIDDDDLSNNTGSIHNPVNQYLSNLVLRSVKPRNFQYGSPHSPLSTMDFSNPSTNLVNNSSGSTSAIARLLSYNPASENSTPVNNSILQNNNFQNQNSNSAEVQTTDTDPNTKTIDHCLLELEKHLLEDNDEEEQEANPGITNNEWCDLNNLINPIIISSPSSSNTSHNSSSSWAVSTAAGSSKQSLMEAATAISEGRIDHASEILNRLAQTLNPSVNFESRLTGFMISALKSRVNHFESPPPVAELFSKEHAESTQLLFDNSLCFKVAFMAANLAIIEATFDETTESADRNNNMKNLCVVDFDIGDGKRYVNLLYELHKRHKGSPATLKITAVVDNSKDEKLKMVEENLSREAEQLGIGFEFKVSALKITELTREALGCNSEDILAVNFAFKLFRIPDESVSTENPRDELLRRVNALAPRVVTLLEQEINTNTAPFVARVGESFSYYSALLDSIESTTERDKIEEGLSRKLGNVVACEGRDRVERCEVFGKWRARLSMAGFRLNSVSQKVAESVKARLEPGSGVIVNEENGGVSFGWMGKTLTVASAWS
ncbi:unnamed protein product [Lathyrus sativus]|nr:unnamed protein product [Lathyrus sativus]